MKAIAHDSVRPTRSRGLRAAVLVVASFAALAVGVTAAVAAGGSLRLLTGIAGFVAYVFLFGRAVREFDVDRFVWDHPDSALLRITGKSRTSFGKRC
jgi:hypothetical protein